MSWEQIQMLTRVFMAGSCVLLVMGDAKTIEYPPVLEGSTVTLSCKGNTTSEDRGQISWQQVTHTESQRDVSTCNLATRKCENYDGGTIKADFEVAGGHSGHFSINLIISNVSVSQKDNIYMCTKYSKVENAASTISKHVITNIYAKPESPICEADSLDDLKIQIVCNTTRVYPSLTCQLDRGQQSPYSIMTSNVIAQNNDGSYSFSCKHTFLESSPGLHFFKIQMFPAASFIGDNNLVADVTTSVNISSKPKILMTLSSSHNCSAPDIVICAVYRLSSLPTVKFVFNHTEYSAEVSNKSFTFLNSSHQKYFAILNISGHSPSADETITCNVTEEHTPGFIPITQTIQELLNSSLVESVCRDQPGNPKANNSDSDDTDRNTGYYILVAQISSVLLLCVVGLMFYFRMSVIDKVRWVLLMCGRPQSSGQFEHSYEKNTADDPSINLQDRKLLRVKEGVENHSTFNKLNIGHSEVNEQEAAIDLSFLPPRIPPRMYRLDYQNSEDVSSLEVDAKTKWNSTEQVDAENFHQELPPRIPPRRKKCRSTDDVTRILTSVCPDNYRRRDGSIRYAHREHRSHCRNFPPSKSELYKETGSSIAPQAEHTLSEHILPEHTIKEHKLPVPCRINLNTQDEYVGCSGVGFTSRHDVWASAPPLSPFNSSWLLETYSPSKCYLCESNIGDFNDADPDHKPQLPPRRKTAHKPDILDHSH